MSRRRKARSGHPAKSRGKVEVDHLDALGAVITGHLGAKETRILASALIAASSALGEDEEITVDQFIKSSRELHAQGIYGVDSDGRAYASVPIRDHEGRLVGRHPVDPYDVRVV